jgi:hypothetical protein
LAAGRRPGGLTFAAVSGILKELQREQQRALEGHLSTCREGAANKRFLRF